MNAQSAADDTKAQGRSGDDAAPLEDILREAHDSSEGEETTLGDIVDSFGAQSLGPIVLIFGLIIFFPPIGALPGVPIALGIVLATYTLQYLFGSQKIWLPQRIRDVSFERDKLQRARRKLEPWLRRIDRLFTERLTCLVGPTASRFAAVAVLLHALLLIPLDFIYAVALPAAALVFFGVALTARDGLMMLLGWVVTIGALAAAIFAVPWSRLPVFP